MFTKIGNPFYENRRLVLSIIAPLEAILAVIYFIKGFEEPIYFAASAGWFVACAIYLYMVVTNRELGMLYVVASIASATAVLFTIISLFT